MNFMILFHCVELMSGHHLCLQFWRDFVKIYWLIIWFIVFTEIIWKMLKLMKLYVNGKLHSTSSSYFFKDLSIVWTDDYQWIPKMFSIKIRHVATAHPARTWHFTIQMCIYTCLGLWQYWCLYWVQTKAVDNYMRVKNSEKLSAVEETNISLLTHNNNIFFKIIYSIFICLSLDQMISGFVWQVRHATNWRCNFQHAVKLQHMLYSTFTTRCQMCFFISSVLHITEIDELTTTCHKHNKQCLRFTFERCHCFPLINIWGRYSWNDKL